MILNGDTPRKCLACGKIYIDRGPWPVCLFSACPECGSRRTIEIGIK